MNNYVRILISLLYTLFTAASPFIVLWAVIFRQDLLHDPVVTFAGVNVIFTLMGRLVFWYYTREGKLTRENIEECAINIVTRQFTYIIDNDFIIERDVQLRIKQLTEILDKREAKAKV